MSSLSSGVVRGVDCSLGSTLEHSPFSPEESGGLGRRHSVDVRPHPMNNRGPSFVHLVPVVVLDGLVQESLVLRFLTVPHRNVNAHPLGETWVGCLLGKGPGSSVQRSGPRVLGED